MSAYGYVSKAFESSELEAAVKAALRRQELGRAMAQAMWPPAAKRTASGAFALPSLHRSQTGT
ncbi:MAG: hypothetical protein JOZ69_05605 [Myxococcales bacterium]|nr:hypothetical protein [Myxococcales bacterium]